MNELFAMKYDELLIEFNRYVMTHPKFLANVPDGAVIILVDPSDAEFNRHSMERLRAYQGNDDDPTRPVVYVDVGKLAPLRSRLVHPRVLTHPPETLAMATA